MSSACRQFVLFDSYLTLSNATTPGQYRPWNNSNEDVLCILPYWSLTIRWFNVISRTPIGGGPTLCRDTVVEFYNPCRLGYADIYLWMSSWSLFSVETNVCIIIIEGKSYTFENLKTEFMINRNLSCNSKCLVNVIKCIKIKRSIHLMNLLAQAKPLLPSLESWNEQQVA